MVDIPYFDTYTILGHTFLLPVHVKLLVAAALIGLTIGLERAFRRKVASLRTFSFICMGSCMFSIISVEAGGAMRAAGGLSPGTSFYDITRVAAGIVTGVGFVTIPIGAREIVGRSPARTRILDREAMGGGRSAPVE